MFKTSDKTVKSIVPRTHGMNERLAFDAWMEMGSLPRAAKYMEQQGHYNKRTGKAFSPFGIRHAACRYIAMNHEIAKPILLKLWRDVGTEISTEEWNRFVVTTATEYLSSSRGRFMRWLEANAWAQQYDYIYADTYGIVPKNRPTV
jgi:hypothetical protein